MATLSDVAGFITSEATEDDLKRIYGFCKTRSKTLRTIRAAAVSKGAQVELTNLSPQYLNGLTGEVASINKDRCEVLLDEKSTDRLKWTRQSRFMVGEEPRYTIRGVPLSSCDPQD